MWRGLRALDPAPYPVFLTVVKMIAEQRLELTATSSTRQRRRAAAASRPGATATTQYETYQDDTIWKASLYRMMEATGISSF